MERCRGGEGDLGLADQEVAFTPDSRFLAAARNDRTVQLWETASWSPAAAFDWQIGSLVSLAIAPDGMRAAAGSKRGKIVVWDIDL
jgi:WD40 repeat protein